VLVGRGWCRSFIRIHHGAVSGRQLSRISDLGLHLARAIAVRVALHMSVTFSVGPATFAYPAEEYCESKDQRSKASTNGSTDDGGVVFMALGWGACCSRNCTCWSPDGVGCCLREIDG